VLDAPPPEGEPWQAFWQGSGPSPETRAPFSSRSPAGTTARQGSTTFQPSYLPEQAAAQNIATYREPEAGGFPGVDIPAGEGVEVACKTFDPTSEFAEDEGYWYLIHSPSWKNEYFAPANAFRNGAHGTETVATDYAVPDC
jgi:hypothetical protein